MNIPETKQVVQFSIVTLASGLLFVALFLMFQVLFGKAQLTQEEVVAAAPVTIEATSSTQTEVLNDFIPEEPTKQEQVEELLDAFVTEHDGNMGIALHSSDNSVTYTYNAEAIFETASLYKPLAAFAVLERINRQELSLDSPGIEGYTVGECIELAITISDNPCGVLLQSLSQPYTYAYRLKELGLTDTVLGGYYPSTTANDYAAFIDFLLSSDSASATTILDAMSRQRILDRLPSYPANAKVFHKTGDLGGTMNSTTIIETDEVTYTITILTDTWEEALLSKYSALADMHEALHQIMSE